MKKQRKIVLAYSGGLDTSIILKWLQENYNAEVITYTADIGQKIDRNKILKKTKALGVQKIIIEDLKDLQNEFYNESMLNRIRSTEPKAVKRNLEKEELVLEELEDDELKEILEELEEEEGKSNQYLWLFISTLVLSIIFFIVHENLHVKLYRFFKKDGKKGVIKGSKKGGKKSGSKKFKFK